MVRTGNAIKAGCAAVAAMVMMGATPAGVLGQVTDSAPDDGAALNATVTVTRALLTEAGGLVRELPSSRYQLAQFHDGRLRLTMLASRPGPRIGPLADPYAGMVVEGNLAHGMLDLRDATGKPLAIPGGTGFPAAPDTGESYLAEAGSTHQRRQTLERAYGRPKGRVRGLMRYVAQRDAAVEEVLVSPETLLPTEVSLVKDGVLTEHHVFSYVLVPGNRWVRHRSTAQTIVSGQTPQRLLSITALDDIRTTRGER